MLSRAWPEQGSTGERRVEREVGGALTGTGVSHLVGGADMACAKWPVILSNNISARAPQRTVRTGGAWRRLEVAYSVPHWRGVLDEPLARKINGRGAQGEEWWWCATKRAFSEIVRFQQTNVFLAAMRQEKMQVL